MISPIPAGRSAIAAKMGIAPTLVRIPVGNRVWTRTPCYIWNFSTLEERLEFASDQMDGTTAFAGPRLVSTCEVISKTDSLPFESKTMLYIG